LKRVSGMDFTVTSIIHSNQIGVTDIVSYHWNRISSSFAQPVDCDQTIAMRLNIQINTSHCSHRAWCCCQDTSMLYEYWVFFTNVMKSSFETPAYRTMAIVCRLMLLMASLVVWTEIPKVREYHVVASFSSPIVFPSVLAENVWQIHRRQPAEGIHLVSCRISWSTSMFMQQTWACSTSPSSPRFSEFELMLVILQ
jgi:hypothetical protein